MVSREEVPTARVIVGAGVGVDLDLAVGQVDNPVDGDRGPGIGPELLTPIDGEGRPGDLDQECHVGGPGLPVHEIVIGTPEDRDVRLRLVVLGDPDRLLAPPRQAGR